MAEEGLVIDYLLGRRRLTAKGAFVDVLAFAAVTIMGGFFLGLGMNAANIMLRSGIREIEYSTPFSLPEGVRQEVNLGRSWDINIS